ncbi:MAG: DNA polymerase IV [Chitinophagaceae bacterium]|nr:DNA polymerase IV [Chitinophagaceae bacterium]
MESNPHKYPRKIIHIDMDAFYASIEQRDNPEYRGKPIVVGGSPEGRGGVVATASYEARKFGIKSAMPSKKALQLCPHVLFIRPRFDAYKEASQKIRAIFHRYTDLIEPLSLDEAFLDVTEDKLQIGSAIDIARQIKQAIKDELNLTASAGISVNKFVAKIASDIDKPDGLTFIGPSRIEQFMQELPVEKFFGVGRVTADKMRKMGLHTGADLKKLSQDELTRHFGKAGRFFFNIVRGIDNREVQPHRETKSIGAEDTFAYDLTEPEEMFAALERIALILFDRLQRHNMYGRTVTVKIKYHDFKLRTRSQSFPATVTDIVMITETAKQLLVATGTEDKKIRLLGITVSNFGEVPVKQEKEDASGQLKLF